MTQPAPLLAADGTSIPAGASAAWFAGAGGVRLRAALFQPAEAARGTVVLSGGRTEPIEKYYEVAGELTGRGFVVLAHDWRGQGLSARLLKEPLKGHASGYHDFIADYGHLLDAFEPSLPRPWLAVGHSMGGALTALALAAGEGRFAGAVLSAPMFGIFTAPLKPAMAGATARFFTLAGLGGGLVAGAKLSPPPSPFEANVLTHDRARYERTLALLAAHPELALGAPTWGWLDFALGATHELRRGAARIASPVTVVAAGDDRLVDNRDLRAVTHEMPRGRYVEAAGAFHEILQETDEIRAVFWREFDALTGALASSPDHPQPN